MTVRTLHHYDEIGLLVPSERSDAGCRLYSEADLERLYRILLYRELDFPLEAIAGLLTGRRPGAGGPRSGLLTRGPGGDKYKLIGM